MESKKLKSEFVMRRKIKAMPHKDCAQSQYVCFVLCCLNAFDIIILKRIIINIEIEEFGMSSEQIRIKLSGMKR